MPRPMFLRRDVMNNRGRSTYEIILVAIVVAMAVAIVVGIYARRTTIHNGRVMIDELFVMRSGIMLYHALNGVYPPSLDALEAESYRDGEGKNVPFVQRLHRDDEKHIIDPFGNPYSYERRTGWVRSITEGYERW